MKFTLEKPLHALLAGLALVVLALIFWLANGPADLAGAIAVVLRFIHVVAAMAWVGLILFVNFIQFGALDAADEPGRKTIAKLIVPQVAAGFRHASHLTVLSGVLLLVASGYLLSEWIFAATVYVLPVRGFLLAAGALGGLLMWAFVHVAIWPSLLTALGERPGDAAAARATVRGYARLNLVLALPVTFTMVAAAHLA